MYAVRTIYVNKQYDTRCCKNILQVHKRTKNVGLGVSTRGVHLYRQICIHIFAASRRRSPYGQVCDDVFSPIHPPLVYWRLQVRIRILTFYTTSKYKMADATTSAGGFKVYVSCSTTQVKSSQDQGISSVLSLCRRSLRSIPRKVDCRAKWNP